MRTENPLANLNRRLHGQPATVDEGDDDDAGFEPSWVPDGRPGDGWLASVRADPGRAGGIALAAIAVLAILVTVFTLTRHHPAPVVSANLPPVEPVSASASSPSGTPAPSSSAQEPSRLVVSVVGLVQQPGLVTLAPDARVADAVTAAGGTLHGADTLGLNLARHVEDGEQIVVGIAAPAGHPAVLGSSVGSGAAESKPGAPGEPAKTDAPPKPTDPVDLNTATVEQLDGLPGVGPVTAAAIVAWRSANGRFNSVDQLGEIDGIGPARLEKLRPLVRV